MSTMDRLPFRTLDTSEAELRYPRTDGAYDGVRCVCTCKCLALCDGRCGCEACTRSWLDYGLEELHGATRHLKRSGPHLRGPNRERRCSGLWRRAKRYAFVNPSGLTHLRGHEVVRCKSVIGCPAHAIVVQPMDRGAAVWTGSIFRRH